MACNWIYFLLTLFATFNLLAPSSADQLDSDEAVLEMIRGQILSLESANHESDELYERLGTIYRKFELTLNQVLSKQVARLPEDVKESADILVKGIRGDIEFKNDRRYDIGHSKLVEGLLELLKRRAEPFNTQVVLDSAKGRQVLDAKIKKVVKPICEQVIKKLLPTINVYDAFKSRGSVIKQIDHYTIDWLLRARACQTILSDSEIVNEKAYIELYRDHFLATHHEERKLLQEWLDLYDRVFNAKYEIEPLELLEYLKRMEEISVKLNPLNLIEESRWLHWQSSRKLIDVSYISKSKCNFAYFVDIGFKRASNRVYLKTIAPYLQHYHIEQYKICQPIFREQLDKSLIKIYSSMRNTIQLGKQVLEFNSINGEERKLPALGQTGIAKGSLNFLKAKVKSLNSVKGALKIKLNSSEHIGQTFEKEILKPCKQLLKYSGDILSILNDIVLYKELREKTNKHFYDWVCRYQICRRITENTMEILNVIQKEALNSKKKLRIF